MTTWWQLENLSYETLPILHVVKKTLDGSRTACGMFVWGARPVEDTQALTMNWCQRCDRSVRAKDAKQLRPRSQK